MGIGNLSKHLQALPRRTPAALSSSSLPLMGIGNRGPHGRGAIDHAPKLITPHGDRERCWPGALRVCHTAHAHYPSWGSGTRSPGTWPHSEPANCHSLPLMGIGNGRMQPAARWSPAVSGLITPHGDREPGSVLETFPQSLPLMGREHPILPHYPSWGSGTHGKARNCRPISLPLMGIGNLTGSSPKGSTAPGSFEAHYPSWGSGTGAVPSPVDHGRTSLITPHGDRELRQKQLATACRDHRSHYPSWGSGTVSRRALDLHRSARSHYPSWGSGTDEQAYPGSTLLELITPHGDRELRRSVLHARRP